MAIIRFDVEVINTTTGQSMIVTQLDSKNYLMTGEWSLNRTIAVTEEDVQQVQARGISEPNCTGPNCGKTTKKKGCGCGK